MGSGFSKCVIYRAVVSVNGEGSGFHLKVKVEVSIGQGKSVSRIFTHFPVWSLLWFKCLCNRESTLSKQNKTDLQSYLSKEKWQFQLKIRLFKNEKSWIIYWRYLVASKNTVILVHKQDVSFIFDDLLLCLSSFQANQQLQQLEEDRISKMNEFLNQYNSNVSVLGPKLTEVCNVLA